MHFDLLIISPYASNTIFDKHTRFEKQRNERERDVGSTTATQAEHHELTTKVNNWVYKLREWNG